MAQGIVLFAHGSRDPRWRAPIEAVAQSVQRQAPQAAVRCAYLELADPDFATAVQELFQGGVRRLRVVPMFLGMGKHAREDLPALVAAARAQHPGLDVELLGAVGEASEVVNLLADLSLRGLPGVSNP